MPPFQLWLLFLISFAVVWAQTPTGEFTGRVTDPSGAAVAGAKITVTDLATGVERQTESNDTGNYTVPLLPPGKYQLTAQKEGFRPMTQSGYTLNVDQIVRVDFALKLGSVSDTVSVVAETPLIETQSASVGQVIENRSVNTLPLNGRNFTFLAQIATGVTVSQQDSRGLGATGMFSANGTRPYENNYLLDGMDNNSDLVDYLNGTYYVVRPPIDAIQEFKVQTSNYSAQFGRGGGAVLNATLKSGTNQLHGDVWEFLRNDVLDATDFFVNAGGQSKGEYRQNQFGFTLGGPLIIPNTYNGHDKTFFFVDYEGLRIRQAIPYVATVPTVLERQSGYTNFTQLIGGQSGTQTDLLGRIYPLGTIFDPSTTRTVVKGLPDPIKGIIATGNGFVRDPFAGNIVPVNRLNAVAIALLNLYPPPTSGSLFNNYTADPVLRHDDNQFDVRIDQNFTEHDQMFGRISYSNEPQYTPGPFPGIADGGSFIDGYQTAISWNGILSETHTFSSSLVNQTKVGYSRLYASRLQPFANQMGIPQQYGIQGIPQVSLNGGLPTFTISGLSTLGSNGFLPSVEINPTLQANDSVNLAHGSHSLAIGYEFQDVRYTLLQPPASRGVFDFNGEYTGIPNQNSGNTGIVQFLLTPISAASSGGFNNVGGADSITASNINNVDAIRTYDAAYLQDDWQAMRRLTINIGIRYEFFSAPIERHDAQANFIPGSPGSGAEYLLPTSRMDVQLSPAFINALSQDGIKLIYSTNHALSEWPTFNLAPRIGVAYQPTNKLVIRAGYGIFFDGFENRFGNRSLGNNYPFLISYSFVAPTVAQPISPNNSIGGLANGLANVSFSPTALNSNEVAGISLRSLQSKTQTPYTQDTNLTMEYQLGQNQSFRVAYVGTFGRHLLVDTNAANGVLEIAPPQVNPQTLVGFKDFARGGPYSATEGNSYYHSLQATFQRRLSNGFNVLANYTYSKVRTDARDLQNNDVGGYRAPLVPGFGIQGDYSLADFDVRHLLHFSGGYELPFGKDKHFLNNRSKLVDALVGGWQTNWILTLQSGQPFTIPCSITTAAGLGCFALMVPGQNPYAGPHNVDHWLNPAAFTNPPVASAVGQTDLAPLGGAPTQVVGPPLRRLDFSLFKEFPIHENTHVEFRTEVFNLTNTPNFSLPGFSGNGVVAAPGALNFTNTANFGKINSTRDSPNDPREIQFALKLYW
jgi:hypothetical protein